MDVVQTSQYLDTGMFTLVHGAQMLIYGDKTILRDPGADSGGEGKSRRATKTIGEEKSPGALDFSSPIFFFKALFLRFYFSATWPSSNELIELGIHRTSVKFGTVNLQ